MSKVRKGKTPDLELELGDLEIEQEEKNGVEGRDSQRVLLDEEGIACEVEESRRALLDDAKGDTMGIRRVLSWLGGHHNVVDDALRWVPKCGGRRGASVLGFV
ncbi:hypothetical protein PIB30_025359 [Stylosanthes scabra]|uniref:Uncharacterized protein n=1 Tax=Stylosanthes scabra TaxID=79078 RepID=A0ABU6YBY9_9FABA|nr:hypothetical protein [Stylosanthes scabra]